MLVYEMNGAVLPPSHGFPARLLVPDIYGMKNVKWVTKIELVGYDFVGYWQRQGWSDVATMHTTSRIDLPRNQSYLRGGRSFVGGVAVAGQRGISRVEVSTDDGRSWQPAVIKPALGPNSWVLWLFEWDLPLDAADRRLLVRAVDGTRAAQVATRSETVPNGATGYHQVSVRLAEN
jgi:hypothetical protein